MQNNMVIPIVLAANQNYVPVLYVCIHSIVAHITEKYYYQIYVFHTDIEQESQQIFKQGLEKQNVRITFCDVNQKIKGYSLQAKEHITSETYYRFLILDILQEFDKVLYLDCDLIVQKDVADLYEIDLKDTFLAAAHDPDFVGQCNDLGLSTRTYCENVLNINDPCDYFQAGVLLLNVKKLRETIEVRDLFQMADTGNYKYSDQDILNIICKENTTLLDMSWNLMTDAHGTRYRDVICLAPEKIVSEYEEARKNPFIVHYAGSLKPWLKPSEDFGYLFWQEARHTIYYEVLLERMVNYSISEKTNPKGIVCRIKDMAKRILPQNSGIRTFVKRCYYLIKRS